MARQGSENPSQPAIEPGKLTLWQILRALTPAQIAALIGAAAVVIGTTFSLGISVESNAAAAESFRKDKQLADLESQMNALKASNEAIAGRVNDALTLKDRYETKAEFLNRWLTYVRSSDPTGKKLFVDAICMMWRDMQRQRMDIRRAPIQLTADQILKGLDPDTRQMLQRSSGFEVQRALAVVDRPAVDNRVTGRAEKWERQRAIADLQKQAQSVRIAKTVTFFDGARYELPQEIAVAVHARPDCAP